MKPIKRSEPGPTRDEILMRHRIIKHNNGDFTVEHNHDWDGLTHKPRTDIDILKEIIKDAHHRIELYEMLDQGLWHNIFNTDNKEPIKDELKLIAEWERMIAEIEQWEKR
tara:strand:- start:522 stop:851 length:330 start_codon:yes stop_codon:yes gene_type:complete